jgi:hypothetical protein
MFGKKERRFGTVSLPLPLIEKIKKKTVGTGFTSVGSYVEYVMREVVSEEKNQEDKNKASRKDEERVKDKLRALGYLD